MSPEITPDISYRAELQDPSGNWFFIEKTDDLPEARARFAYWEKHREEHASYPERIVEVKKWRQETVIE